ncbi:MAG TPA: hypothetical protein VLA39_09075 [Marinobacterium sp.]|nr:hypothetical protein [Marinobacterium sp.]
MSATIDSVRKELDKLEQLALDEPDHLFAISYLRSHLDLISEAPLDCPLAEALERAVESTFDADNMSASDRSEVLQLISKLA